MARADMERDDDAPVADSAPARPEAWLDWKVMRGEDPFEDHVGPFYLGHEGDERVCGFVPGAHHANGSGYVHGGALLTFADVALFHLGNDRPFSEQVTVTLTTEFLNGARPGRPLVARGGPTRAGRRLIFVRGTIFDEDLAIATFSGTITAPRTTEAPV